MGIIYKENKCWAFFFFFFLTLERLNYSKDKVQTIDNHCNNNLRKPRSLRDLTQRFCAC